MDITDERSSGAVTSAEYVHKGRKRDRHVSCRRRTTGDLGQFMPRREAYDGVFAIKRGTQQMRLQGEVPTDRPEARAARRRVPDLRAARLRARFRGSHHRARSRTARPRLGQSARRAFLAPPGVRPAARKQPRRNGSSIPPPPPDHRSGRIRIPRTSRAPHAHRHADPQ